MSHTDPVPIPSETRLDVATDDQFTDDEREPIGEASAGRRPRLRRRVVVALVLLVSVLALAGLLRLTSGDSPGSSPATSAPPATIPVPEGSTFVANLSHDIDAYGEPGGRPTGTVPANWHDQASSLPVIDQRPGWLEVRLAPRPNGSTAWVRRDDVELTATTHRIEINLATMRLRLYDKGEIVLDAPAGIGRDDAPTPVGNYFVTFFQEVPTPEWGPFAIVTSAHSETISDWEASGDAIIAIHGALGSDAAIGDTGAKISAGCIRLHDEHIAALRTVPAGSPVDIIDQPPTI